MTTMYDDPDSRRIPIRRNIRLAKLSGEPKFDRLNRLLKVCFNATYSEVAFVDEDCIWYQPEASKKTRVPECLQNCCAFTTLTTAALIIEDLASSQPLPYGVNASALPKHGFYISAPLHDSSGLAVGSLCVYAPEPRHFSKEDKVVLEDFVKLFEKELFFLQQQDFNNDFAASLARIKAFVASLPDLVLVVNRSLQILMCNEHSMIGLPRLKILGRHLSEVLPESLTEFLTEQLHNAFDSGALLEIEHQLPDHSQSFEMRILRINTEEVLVIIRDNSAQTRYNLELKKLSEVARQTTNGIVITDLQGRVTWINEAFSEISGYTLDDMMGKKPGTLLQGSETDPAAIATIKKALSKGEGFNVDLINYAKTGEAYWIRISCNPLYDDDGKKIGFIAVQSDISQEVANAEHIRAQERLLKAVIDVNMIGTWHLNLDTGQLKVNDKYAQLLGYDLAELDPVSRQTIKRLTHPSDWQLSLAAIDAHVKGQEPLYDANVRMRHSDGSWRWLNARGRISGFNKRGKPEWLLGTLIDIHDQMMVESTLFERSKQIQVIIDNIPDAVLSIDEEGLIESFNPAAEQIFGYSCGKILGQQASRLLVLPESVEPAVYLHQLLLSNQEKSFRSIELEGLHKDGRLFPIELSLAEIERLGKHHYIVIVKDITQRKKHDQDIHQLAFYDPLTWLPNRRLLMDRLRHIQQGCALSNQFSALMFLDLDNFKSLNDTAGHSKGDMLLFHVAQRLSETVRHGDTVSRLGGDEFVVVIEHLSSDEAQAASQAEAAAEKILNELSKGFDLEGLSYNTSASIGVTLFKSADTSIDELLRQADMAMYKAKGAGRNMVFFYDPKLQVEVNSRVALERDLHQALELGQFELYYQKQVNFSGTVVGAEALIRWRHPERGMVSPAAFIPIAEECGLIVPIGEWVLHEAGNTLARWAVSPDTANLTLAVNLSVVQFSHKKDIVSTVLEALEKTGANPKRLKLEITESLLASNIPGVKAKMQLMQRHGITFSIDDFGTGYSSLSYLRMLPINQLKIDQSFVRDIIKDQNAQAIAQAVITLAQAMQLDVIAEGVEMEEQRKLLEKMGCSVYQGFMYGKPCPLAQFDTINFNNSVILK